MSYARLHMPKIQPIFGVFSPYKMRLSSLCQTYWKWYRRYMQHAHLSAPCAACSAASFFCRLSSERSMVTGNGIVCDMCAGTVFCCSFSTHNHFRLFVASFCASLLIQSNRVCVCNFEENGIKPNNGFDRICVYCCWLCLLENNVTKFATMSGICCAIVLVLYKEHLPLPPFHLCVLAWIKSN